MSTLDAEPASGEQRSRERTRERLVEAAFEIFSEQGFNAPSVEAIAERAGFTRGAFYSNFESKVDLFFAVTDAKHQEAFRSLSGGVDDALAQAIPPGAPITAEAVQHVIAQILQLTDNGHRSVLFDSEFEALALRDRTIAQRYVTYRERARATFATLIGEALGRIQVRFTVPTEQATRLLISAFEQALKNGVLANGVENEIPTDEVLADVTALAYALTERIPAGRTGPDRP